MAALPPAWQSGELVRLATRQHVVVLTFDGGANDAGAASVLATLRRSGTPATFFLSGRFVSLYPAVARQIGQHFPVGDHTVDHSDLTRLSDAEVSWEIRAARSQIIRATVRDARPWLRFPTGRETREPCGSRDNWATCRCAGPSTPGAGLAAAVRPPPA